MNNIIKLHLYESKTDAYINFNNVNLFIKHLDENFTTIRFIDSNSYAIVIETPEEIMKLLEESNNE